MSKVPHNVFCTKFSQNSSKGQQNIMPYVTGRYTIKNQQLNLFGAFRKIYKSYQIQWQFCSGHLCEKYTMVVSWNKLKLLVNTLPMGVFLMLMFQINKDYQISD